MSVSSAHIERIIRARFRDGLRVYDQLPNYLQNAIITARGYFLSRLRYQPLFWETLEQILSHDEFLEKQLMDYQNAALRKVVQHAYEHIPFYRQVMDSRGQTPINIQGTDDLRAFPLLQRQELRSNFEDLLMPGRNDRIIVHTSGSSGAGIPIAYNQNDLARNWAFMFRQFIWAGTEPGDWRITLFGSKVVPENQQQPPYWRYNFFEKQILLSIFHLSARAKRDYLAFLERHQGFVIEGFASVLGIVADFVLQENMIIPMKLVYSTGEPLDAGIRQKVEEAFECKVYDCYGMTEWAGLIQECEKGEMHLISDFGILEILDENNRSVAPGEEGYLVWTSLQKEEMPLIRYKVGDKGIWHLKYPCECGRPYPLVHASITRDSDILQTPTGELFSPRVINQFLKDKVAFNACQFIQTAADQLTIRIVPGKGDYQTESANLVNDLDRLFRGSVELNVSYADKPIMRGQGKFPLIMNRISVPLQNRRRTNLSS